MIESLVRITKGTIVGFAALLLFSAISFKISPLIFKFQLSPEKSLVMGTILLLAVPGIAISIYSLWSFFTGAALSFGVANKIVKPSKKTPKTISGKIIVLLSRIHLLIFGVGVLLANLYYADTVLKLLVLK